MTAALGSQMVTLLKDLHSKDYIHRDIKPENFLFSRNMKQLYLIDFGLSKKCNSSTTVCYNPDICKGLIGNPRYASINAHMGCNQSFRDDLESMFYVLIYLMRGRLPWQRLSVKNKDDRLNLIMEKKLSISINELCAGLPSSFFF